MLPFVHNLSKRGLTCAQYLGAAALLAASLLRDQTGDATLAQLLWRRERYWKTRGGWQGCLNEAARADIAEWLTERDPE